MERALYEPGELVLGEVSVTNPGDQLSATLLVQVVDVSGFVVTTLLEDPGLVLAFGERATWEVQFDSGDTFAGEYRISAILTPHGSDPTQIEQPIRAEAAFRLGETFELASLIRTDRVSYQPGNTVALEARVDHLSGNAALTGLQARFLVTDSNGAETLVAGQALSTLVPGGSLGTSVNHSLPAGSVLGAYRASVEIVQPSAQGPGLVLSRAETPFEVQAQPALLLGAIQVPATPPASGESLDVSFLVRNTGGVALSQVPVRLVLRSADLLSTYAEAAFVLDVAASGDPGDEWAQPVQFDSSGLPLGALTLVLEADQDGVTRILASATLQLVDRTPPVVAILAPVQNGLLGTSGEIRIEARDALSGISLLELVLDHGTPLDLTGTNAGTDLFRQSTATLADGPHLAEARTVDGWGNEAKSERVAFVIDTVPPVIDIAGVVDTQVSSTPLVPVITVTDEHPGTTSITLNGTFFQSGQTVDEPGLHELVVVATDAAGNRSEAVVRFEIEASGSPSVVIGTEQPTYAVGDEAKGEARVRAPAVAFAGRLQVTVESSTGMALAVVVDRPVALDAQALLVEPWSWLSDLQPAGTYRAHAELFESDGAGGEVLVAEDSAEFVTEEQPEVLAAVEITSDRQGVPARRDRGSCGQPTGRHSES